MCIDMENFFKAIVEDEELQESILNAESEEEIYEIAQDYMDEEVSFEEFCEALYWEYNESRAQQLSEEKLVSVTGGRPEKMTSNDMKIMLKALMNA